MVTPSRPAPRRLLAAAAILALLAGCAEEDHLSEVVVRAGNEMTAASGNGVSMPPAEMRDQTYKSVVAKLRDALRGNESEPGAAAAKMLLAQALLGQADVAAERAGDARRDLLYRIAQVRSRLDLQSARDTIAHAYSNYDPSSDLSGLDESQRQIERELESLRAALADKQKRIQTLREQMAEQKAAAEERVGEAARIRAQATDASAVQRAEMIAQANEIERTADQHEKRYAETQLLVGSLESESEEIRIRIASAQRRNELVREARQRIEASADLLESQSAGARTDAQNIASEVGSAFDTLIEAFEQKQVPAFEEAAGKYREAASQAAQARDEVASSAPAVAAMAQHAAAKLHLAQADLLENFHLLAQDLADQLQAQRFAQHAAALDQRMAEIRNQAADLYESAGSTYARLTLAGGDSLQELSTRFQEFAGRLRGQAPDAAPPMEPMDDTPIQEPDAIGQDQPEDAPPPEDIDDQGAEATESDSPPEAG